MNGASCASSTTESAVARRGHWADCHLHTRYSGHGTGTVEEMCCAAEQAGLETIAFTEHLRLPFEVDPHGDFSMTLEQETLYRDEVFRARESHPDLVIVYGCEADWRPGAASYLEDLMSGYDFKLGSVHMLADGYCFDDPAVKDGWKTRGADTIWNAYLDLWLDAASSDIGFTSMAHPDLAKKFGIFPSFDLEARYREAARVAVAHGVAMEVSTAGLRKPVGEFYPSRDYLRICVEEGASFTIGSDAHSPHETGYLIPEAYDYLASCGATSCLVPREDGTLARWGLDGSGAIC